MSVSVSQQFPEKRVTINKENNYNDFNYPSLNHKDIISIRNLDSNDFPIRKFKQLDTKRDFSLNNYTLDIPGAVPRRYGLYSRKPEYNNTNLDIEGSSPAKLYKKVNKPDFIYSNKDIEFSVPRGHHVFQNDRHLNPLNPEYKLPSFSEPTIEYNQKFIRDTLNISDIEGAQTKNYYKYKFHDNINVFNEKVDDEMIYNKIKNRKGKNYNYLDYRDVYAKKEFSNRHINPLDPVYTLNYLNGESYTYGEIDGNKPHAFSKYNTEKDGKGNKTDDIEYAQSDTKGNLRQFNIKYNRPLVYVAEKVVGAQPGTKRVGIRSARMTNPLVPNYQYPGVREEREKMKMQNKRYVSHNNIFDNRKIENIGDSNNSSFRDDGDSSFNINNSGVIEGKNNVNDIKRNNSYDNLNKYDNHNIEDNIINNNNDIQNNIEINNNNEIYNNNNIENNLDIQNKNDINNYNDIQKNNNNIENYNNFQNNNNMNYDLPKSSFELRNQDLNHLSRNRNFSENYTQTDNYSNNYNIDENYNQSGKNNINNYSPIQNNVIGDQPNVVNVKQYYNALKPEQKYYPYYYKPDLSIARTKREVQNNPYENQLSEFLKIKH